MGTIEYPIDELLRVAQDIDHLRFDACSDSVYPPYGQQTPHHHDADVNTLQDTYNRLFADLQTAVNAARTHAMPYHDTLFSVQPLEETVHQRLDDWNQRARAIYNEYYSAIAEVLRDAAETMAALDADASRALRNGPTPQ